MNTDYDVLKVLIRLEFLDLNFSASKLKAPISIEYEKNGNKNYVLDKIVNKQCVIKVCM